MFKTGVILNLMKMVYKSTLRDALKEKVEKTDNDLDDFLVNMVDKIFGFED